MAPTGKVTAIDVAEDSLKIAKEKARQHNIANVQFLNLDVREVESLGQQFDFAYGRWVLVFLANPYRLLKKIYNVIKPGGIFTYESTNVRDPGLFSYPIAPVVAQYADMMKTFNANSGRESEFGYRLYGEFKSLGLENIHLRINQPILVTAEEKSVLRLPMTKLSEEILKFMPVNNYEKLIADLKQLETSDSYVGFFRNIMIAGTKS